VKTHEKFGGAFSLGREAAFIAAPISSGAFGSEVIADGCTLMSLRSGRAGWRMISSMGKRWMNGKRSYIAMFGETHRFLQASCDVELVNGQIHRFKTNKFMNIDTYSIRARPQPKK
jgi:hypothetical protein